MGAGAGIPGGHPAVAAVKAACDLLGKTPKHTAKVRVFASEQRPAAMDILAAAIRAAELNDQELDALFSEVRAAA